MYGNTLILLGNSTHEQPYITDHTHVLSPRTIYINIPEHLLETILIASNRPVITEMNLLHVIAHTRQVEYWVLRTNIPHTTHRLLLNETQLIMDEMCVITHCFFTTNQK